MNKDNITVMYKLLIMMAFLLTPKLGHCDEYDKSYNWKSFGLNGRVAKVTVKDCQFKKEFGETTRVGSKDEKQVYFYGNGNVYKVINSLTSYNKYDYDDHGNMTFEMRVNKEGGECSKIDDYTFCDDDTTDVKEYKHIYSSNGKLSETKVFSIKDGSSTQIERIIYSYSAGGKKITTHDKNSIISEIVINGLDRHIRAKTNDLSWSISKDKLDNKGHLIKRIITAEHEFLNIKKVQNVSSQVYSYDNHGNVINQNLTLYLNEQNPIKENLTSKYTYDNHGNWVSMMTYNGNKLVSWKEREIIYAENESDFAGIIQNDIEIEKTRRERLDKYKKMLAEKNASLEEEKAKAKAQEIAKGPIEINVDVEPAFPGGPARFLNWIYENLRYPKEAEERGEQGQVVVNFVVECDGSASNIKIVRRVSKDIDNEAIRLIKSMPKWNPGMIDGHAVRCYYTQAITFRL